MSAVSTPKMTAEEFFEWANLPENAGKRYELDNGEIVEMASPGELHGVVCWLVAHVLGNYLFARRAGYICTNDTGLIVRRSPDTVRGPDVMLYLAQRSFDELSPKHAERIPDLIVEVFSPTDRLKKTHDRVVQYLKRGVRFVWVVYPEEQSVQVFRSVDEFPRILDESDELTGNGILPDFRCRVADLFAMPGVSSPPSNP